MVVNELYSECVIHLRTVGDIPRLYRRTNREAPTKCFSYVHQMLSVINDFRSLHQNHAKKVDEWTRSVLQILTKQLSPCCIVVLLQITFELKITNLSMIVF